MKLAMQGLPVYPGNRAGTPFSMAIHPYLSSSAFKILHGAYVFLEEKTVKIMVRTFMNIARMVLILMHQLICGVFCGLFYVLIISRDYVWASAKTLHDSL